MTLTTCEAASLRYVHDVLTGDFVTIGLVLYCPDRRFVGARTTSTFERVKGAFPTADQVHLRRIGIAVQEVCEEWYRRENEELPLARSRDLASLLPALIPIEDAALQFSPIMSGVTADPERTLNELFERYVGQREERPERVTRNEHEIWRAFAKRLADPTLLKKLHPRVVKVRHYEWEFRHSWKNGAWHAVQELSFDMLDARDIKEKAVQWSGRLQTLRPRDQDVHVKMLVAVPPKSRPRQLRAAAQDGMAILLEGVAEHAEVVPEDQSDRLARQIIDDLSHAD